MTRSVRAFVSGVGICNLAGLIVALGLGNPEAAVLFFGGLAMGAVTLFGVKRLEDAS